MPGLVKEAEAEIRRLALEAEKLQTKKLEIEAQLEGVQAQISSLVQYLKEKSPDKAKPYEGVGADSLTMVDRIDMVLRKAGKPLHYMEILRRLHVEQGFQWPGRNPKSNLTARLAASKRFVRTKKATYGLEEWQANSK